MTHVPIQCITTDQWLCQYDHHLEHVTGVAVTTRKKYLYFASKFLTAVGDSLSLDWSLIKASQITAFVEREAASRLNHGRKDPAIAVRSLLRYLFTEGVVHAGLIAAVPVMRQVRLAALPRPLSGDEVERVLAACPSTPHGLRDFAIVLLLSRLGMRAGEVARLSFDDIDWRQGHLVVRLSKSHRERILPLSQEVGEALVAYIRDARPKSSERYLFLSHKDPHRALLNAPSITHVVKRLLPKASIPARTGGAHLFRHAAATQMVRRGATFKEVADVLGHKALVTTTIYAKLDLATLSLIALPCPGGDL